MRLRAVLLVSLGLLLASESLAQAASPAPTPPVIECTLEQIHNHSCGGHSGGGGSGGSGGGSGGGSTPVHPVRDPDAAYTQYEYVTMCSGNTRTNANDVMCQGAATACDYVAGAPVGSTAFWIWTRLYDPKKPESQQAGWVRQPGFVCRGGVGDTAPDVPTIAQVIDAVNEDFKDFVVVKGATEINPSTKTLVHVDTIFSTDRTGPEALPPLNILGYRVDITVKPERYVWHWDDGTKDAETTKPGRPLHKDVTHKYGVPGGVNPYVSIEWSGTFTINGGVPLKVRGRVTTDGPPSPLLVTTARSELVSK